MGIESAYGIKLKKMKNEITSAEAIRLFIRQQAEWETARYNYEALKQVKVKEFKINGYSLRVQFNPARIRSSAAKTDASSLQNRPCFLCPSQLPPEQEQLPFYEDYWLMVNPFPIFPQHFTMPVRIHQPQLIGKRYADMLKMARSLDDFILFYNGPKCGASAPDHAHFQAGSKGILPIEREWRTAAKRIRSEEKGGAEVFVLRHYLRNAFVIEADNAEVSVRLFSQFWHLLETKPGEDEPMLNLLIWFEGGKWITCLFPRALHRPACYFAEEENNILISPASVDMGGLLILPRERDFEKMTESDIEQIFREVCLSDKDMERMITAFNLADL